MRLLFIGGTGLISSACSQLAVEQAHELWLLNRATSTAHPAPDGARLLRADVHDEEAVARLIDGLDFDVVVDWIAFTPADIERDLRLWAGRTGQFVFISSASAYQKPPDHYLVTESTPLANPFWQYSRDKIACERRLAEEAERTGFPVTVIRPSLTYGPSQVPLPVNAWRHPWTVVERMRQGREVIVPGDGTSLWVLTWNGDFAVGLLGLLGRAEAIGEAFHITSDEVLTWDQATRAVAHAAGVEPRIVHVASDLLAAWDPDAVGTLLGDKIHSTVFDNAKVRRLVPSFRPRVTFAEGIARSIAWFEADPARRTVDMAADAAWDRILAAYRRAWPGG